MGYNDGETIFNTNTYRQYERYYTSNPYTLRDVDYIYCDELTTEQQWISFGVDTAYTLSTFVIGYGVGAAVACIPVVGVFIAPFASAGATWLIDYTNKRWSWLDEIKQWIYE